MKKLILTSFVCLSLISISYSQAVFIKGLVIDSSANNKLKFAAVAILRSKDSVMIGFSRSDLNGDFSIQCQRADRLIVLISHPLYADFVDYLDLGPDTALNLGTINMVSKKELLQEVIVSNSSAIRLKGDTTEFKVDSFYLRPGSTVEDLLKKLPGLQVDRNGQITANGVRVDKILVDGEEFFSDDPTIVTQNVLADAIDKVQVYDKKSDQTNFTGIDDGKRLRTIDLKLKANRKHGIFGKLEAGSDAKNYWNNSTMLNAFKGKRKLTGYAVMSSTGKTGLSMKEAASVGSFNNDNVGQTGNLLSLDEENGVFYGEGLPKGVSLGSQYSNKSVDDRNSINTNYQFKTLSTAARGNILSKYVLPDTLYYIRDNGFNQSTKYQHKATGTFEMQLDTGSSMKFTMQGLTGAFKNNNYNSSEALSESEKLVNSSDRRFASDGSSSSIANEISYRKKFAKPGQTISLSIVHSYTDLISDGLLQADYRYYDELTGLKQIETIDQQKRKHNLRSGVSGKIVYTKPVSKQSIVELTYNPSNSYGKSTITTSEKDNIGDRKYDVMVDSLSNRYSLNIFSNSAGLSYRYANLRKMNFSIGTNVANAHFTRRDLRNDSSTSYNYLNLSPRFIMNIKLQSGWRISLYYYGFSLNPGIDLIQPVKDNSDLLNQRIGNPNLKPSFTQYYSLAYSKYSAVSGRLVNASVTYTNIVNDFSYSNFVDDFGRRLVQPINIKGNRSLDGVLFFNTKLSPYNIALGSNLVIRSGRNISYINRVRNLTNSFTLDLGTSLAKKFLNGIEITVKPQVGYVRSTSSVRKSQTTSFFMQDHNLSLILPLPFKSELFTDCTVSLRQKTDAFTDNVNAVRWNAHFDKKVLKSGLGIIRVSVNDILNQNIGLIRNVSTNFLSERHYNTIRRYILLSFIWNFNKSKTE